MIYRLYVERREAYRQQANALLSELKNLLNIKNLENLRILERYDIENINGGRGESMSVLSLIK